MALTTYATSTGAAIASGADNDADDTTWTRAAIEALRAAIEPVPGSGPVRGVWMYKGDVYAFRDNDAGTFGAMHKSSSAGWAEQSLGYEMAFNSGGVTVIAIGDTVVGTSSGHSAVVTDMSITNVDWAGGLAAGVLHFMAHGGSGSDFLVGETLYVGASANIATVASVIVSNVLPAAGRYEFRNENFLGGAYTKKMYGVNGVGKGFQWDGTNFAFITTGMTVDTPSHLIEHRKHLFFAFPNGSVQHSSIGTPMNWVLITGAGEISTSGEITGFVGLPGQTLGDSLAILNRNATYVLYGTGAASWDLKNHSDESGAVEWSAQRMGRPFYLDDRGLTDLAATDRYGDFDNNILSEKVKRILTTKKDNILCSTRVRDKNQYRLMFDDGTALTGSFEKDASVGYTEQSYDHIFNCACSAEDLTGSEVLFVGTTADSDTGDAYVMQMDSGTSFDGGEVEAFLRPAFNHFKSPEHKKRFYKVALEVTAPDEFTMQFTPDMTYSEIEDVSQTLTGEAAGGFWDVSNWDDFEWGGAGFSNPYADIDGSGKNLGLFIFTVGTYERPHTIHSATVHYGIRGLSR